MNSAKLASLAKLSGVCCTCWILTLNCGLAQESLLPQQSAGQRLAEKFSGTQTDRSRGVYFPPPGESLVCQCSREPLELGLAWSVTERLKGKAPNARWALWRHGYLLHVEGDFNALTEVKSLRKTWHALAVGAAMQLGKLASLDQPLAAWNPELSGQHATATWRDVMTQTSGFDYPYGDWPACEPGQMWTYSDKNPREMCNALARVFGRDDFKDHYDLVMREAYFDAIGLRGWQTSIVGDGIRFHFDLEDMGRLGLLVLCGGNWNGQQLIPADFVAALETKQTHGAQINYDGPDDGHVNLDPHQFPEAPYGYMTWVNTDGRFFPGADRAWAWGAGAGGSTIMWNRRNGIVFAGLGVNTDPTTDGIPHIIEACIIGPNPAARPQ